MIYKVNSNVKKIIRKYSKSDFKVKDSLSKIKNIALKAGKKAIYAALLLYYAFRKKETPKWAKSIIVGTIAYLVAPIDIIPDLSPILGYTDDFTVLMYGVLTISTYIDDDVKTKSKDIIDAWFNDSDSEDVLKIDEKLD